MIQINIMKINRNLGLFAGLACLVGLGCSEASEPKGLENKVHVESTVEETKAPEPVKPVPESVLPEHVKLDYGFREEENFDKILETYSMDHLKDVLGEKYTNLTDEEKETVKKASLEDRYYILTVCESHFDSSLKSPEDKKDFKVSGLSEKRKKEYLKIYPWIKEGDFDSMDGSDRSLIGFSEESYNVRKLSLDLDLNPQPGSFMHTYSTINNLVDFVSNGVRESYKALRDNTKK